MRSQSYGGRRTERPPCKRSCKTPNTLRRVPDTFTHSIRVRYGECDPQDVVFNSNWLAYFDVVLTELWRERVGGYQEMIDAGTDMVVAEANVRYLGPAGFDDVVDFELSVTRLGRTALGTRIVATVEGRPAVEGAMRHVFIDPATKEKKAMPEGIRQALTALLVAEEPVAS
ncbi:MAG: acyl-CoA thioester hydrolase [Thermoleophilaceae bacterium]|nr:acyl-CoA thioester hydrolase [Thermoleophilaceae bacterium]